jgi:hypothetical protein
MTIQDVNTPDPTGFQTPDGQPLNAGARNPHQQADIVHGGNADNDHAEVHIEQELVDFVAEHQIGGTEQNITYQPAAPDPARSFFTRVLAGNPFYSPFPNAIFWNTDGVSRGEAYATIENVVAGTTYHLFPFTSTSNTAALNIEMYFGDQSQAWIPNYYDGYHFVANTSGTVEFGFRILENSGLDGINSLNMNFLQGATTVPASCTDFIRFIDDGIITGDYNSVTGAPYVVQGVAMPHCPIPAITPPIDVPLQLVDIYQSGGSGQIDLPVQGAWSVQGNGASFDGNVIVLNSDAELVQAYMLQNALVVGATYTLGFNANGTGFAGLEFQVNGTPVTPITNAQFVATQADNFLQLVLPPSNGERRLSDIVLYYDIPLTQECQPFVRKESGDFDLDGNPYIVKGTVSDKCPSSCECSEKFDELQAALDSANVTLQALLDASTPPAQTLLETGQPVLTLSGGASGATFTRDEIAHYGVSPSLIQASGYSSFISTPPQPSYLLNSISFVPSDDFQLSIAGGDATTHDYTFAMQANSTPYQFEEVDDFFIIIPANQTVTLHMTVGLYPSVTP